MLGIEVVSVGRPVFHHIALGIVEFPIGYKILLLFRVEYLVEVVFRVDFLLCQGLVPDTGLAIMPSESRSVGFSVV